MLSTLVRPMTKALALEIVARRFALLRRLKSRQQPNRQLCEMQTEFCGRAMRTAALQGATAEEINAAIESAHALEGACS